ncbi:MAG: tRNA (adenosine(37)-N6)-threonylcarbamoyltransferase complex dimerization subunit type 1 TsaB, partial [Pseudomonadota bacterium]
MKLLAIETATEACSVALAVDGDVRDRFEIAPRGHAGLVLPMAKALLAEAGLGLRELDALVFGRGPGAFTGLRIAAGVVQGLAYGAELPVVPVSSLATLAQGVSAQTGASDVLAVFDARMGEVYWGAFR